jgi:aminomethyltransferase
MILNPAGGVIDDCIITRYEDHVFVVINAGCKDKDIAHFQQKLTEFKGDVTMEIVDKSLVALQGPLAHKVLSQYVSNLDKLPFMSGLLNQSVKGIPVQVTRCGYTGEDGFEISAEHKDVEALTELFLTNPDVQMIGLGARDSLRLEAGMCLYGHELNETINPVAARLMWCITKDRMTKGGFIGYDKVKEFRDKQQELVPQVRVGVMSQGPVARDATPIQLDGKVVGNVTSGCPSPTVGKNIAMAYVDRALANKGQKVQLNVRNKLIEGEVVTLPFTKPNYYKL